jgi:hypothetical protein
MNQNMTEEGQDKASDLESAVSTLNQLERVFSY